LIQASDVAPPTVPTPDQPQLSLRGKTYTTRVYAARSTPAATAASRVVSEMALVLQVFAIGKASQPITLPFNQAAWNEFSRMNAPTWLKTTS
jgi:hypothetical protein